MLPCSKYKYSYRFLVVLILLLLATYEVLQMKSSGTIRDTSATIESIETTFTQDSKGIHLHSTKYVISKTKDMSFDSFKRHPRSFNPHSGSASTKNLIFKGRPNIFFGSSRPTVPIIQPTPSSGATTPMRPLHLPYSHVTRSVDEILASSWIARLHNLLRKTHQAMQVSVILSNVDYLENLLNWLIAAQVRVKPPVKNVIVICLDLETFSLLNERDIPSIYINPDAVIRPGAKMKSRLSHIWIIRCVLYRLINYFGFDVASYDSDAIILKNPQPLFEQHGDSDVIGSAGRYPFELGRQWGFTLCMGVVLFRNTPRTELLWKAMDAKNMEKTLDDQARLNYALNGCGIQWKTGKRSIKTQSVDGRCSAPSSGNLKVTVLSQTDICRRCIRKKSDHYILHQISKKIGSSKSTVAKERHTWFLRKDWKIVDSIGRRNGGTTQISKGTVWLASLSLSQ